MEHALRGILDAGGNIQKEWKLEDALRAGDLAVGVNVLQPLYSQLKDKAVSVDLGALWAKLRVQSDGDCLHFDDNAEMAENRRAITAGEAAAAEHSLSSKPLAVFAGCVVGTP